MCEGGENCLKNFKRRETGKRGGQINILKRGASWVKGFVPLKGRGDSNLLSNNVNNKRKNMNEKMKKVIQKCSVNKPVFGKNSLESLFNRVSGLDTCNFNHLLLSFVKFF